MESSPITRPESLREQSHKNIEVTSKCRWQYNVLTWTESSRSKRLVVFLIVIYLFVGMLQILFDLDLICLSPHIETTAGITDKLKVLTAPHIESMAFIEHEDKATATSLLQVTSRYVLKRSLLGAQDLQHNVGPRSFNLLQAVPPEERLPQLQCLSPFSKTWSQISVTFSIICLCISSLLFCEHVCRMVATSPSYYYHHWVLLQDFVVTGLCFAGDFSVAVFLSARLLQNLSAGSSKHGTVVNLVYALQVFRLVLSYRIYLHLRNEYHPASEICRAVEVLELMQHDMPGIVIKNMNVIRNDLRQIRDYEERRTIMNMHDIPVEEKLLFLGSGSLPPTQIMEDPDGLTETHSIAIRDAAGRVFGKHALYGAERPAFSDCCAFVDWESDESGQTRQMLIYQALVGSVHEHEGTTKWKPEADDKFDAVCGGPWAPAEYAPQDFGLPSRDIESQIYAFHQPHGQALLIACVTYENPNSFEEIAKLREANVYSWAGYQNDKQRLSQSQEAALKALAKAIEDGDEKTYLGAMKNCKEEKLTDKQVDQVKDAKKEESESAGVSLAYILSDEFLEMARKATGKEDPTFIEMSGPFFTEEKQGRLRIGEGRMCPRDLKPGAALIDTLPRRFRRKATHFMSWVWRYRLSVVLEALRKWLENSGWEAEDVFLFICFCCNNQWRILVEKQFCGAENLEVVFESRLQSIGRLIAVMDNWDGALYCERIWTIFEQYVAAKLDIDVCFTLPTGPSNSMIEQLEMGKKGIVKVINAISHVDCEVAKATMPEDEQLVKTLISEKIGFQKVNERVKRSISTWVAKEFKGRIDSLIE